MTVDVALTHPFRMVSVSIVAPAEDADMGMLFRQQVPQPIDKTIVSSPSLLSVTVQAMHGDDASSGSAMTW